MLTERKNRKKTLSRELLTLLLQSAAAGCFVFVFLYFGGYGCIEDFFLTSSYLYDAELQRIEELQEDVTAEKISMYDYESLRQWADDRDINSLQISIGDENIVNITFEEEYLPDEWNRDVVVYRFEPVIFSDGDAQVYIYDGTGQYFYRILLIVSFASGFLVIQLIFLYGLREKIQYIEKLQAEVAALPENNWRSIVTIEGTDELSELAENLEEMRNTILEQQHKENMMRAAQKKMVLGMSHDLKTPLTGILANIELLREGNHDQEKNQKYIENTYTELLRLRNLSNQVFEFFLIDSSANVEMQEEIVGVIFQDYFSTLYATLEAMGFQVDAEGIHFSEQSLMINPDYLGRIINNLMSNIEKYASYDHPIVMSSECTEQHFIFTLSNFRRSKHDYVEGSGIGLENVKLMMKKMKGQADVTIREEEFSVCLTFLTNSYSES